jgi:hypothetical protein
MVSDTVRDRTEKEKTEQRNFLRRQISFEVSEMYITEIS